MCKTTSPSSYSSNTFSLHGRNLSENEVESSELFGHSMKKLLKFALSSSDIAPLKQFEGCLRGNFPKLLHYPTLYLLYLDEDVSDFVLLDGNTWSDFVLQKKHHVKIGDEAENEIVYQEDEACPPRRPPHYLKKIEQPAEPRLLDCSSQDN
eukprot:scaffold1665_cov183-Ochromonas_danica.AAC.3